MIRFQCPTCRNPIALTPDHAGQKIPCPQCGQRLQVPQAPAGLAKTVLGETLPATRPPVAFPPQVIEPVAVTHVPAGPTVVIVNQRQGEADPFGIISLIFGAIAVVCLLAGCLLYGIPWVVAVPMAMVGVVLGFFAKGNLKVAGLTLNALALVPAVGLAVMVLGCCGILSLGSLLPAPSGKTGRTTPVAASGNKSDVRPPVAPEFPDFPPGLDPVPNQAARDQAKKEREKKKQRDAEREREQAEQAARREKERLRLVRNETRQSLLPRDKEAPIPKESGKWADAAEYDVQQGAASVRVSDVQQKEDQIAIRLTVSNVSQTRPLDFRPWSAASGEDAPLLIGGGANPFGHVPKLRPPIVVAPSESTPDVLSFRGLLPDGDLQLELPASVIRGEGKLRVTIPKALVTAWNAPVDEKGVAALAALLPDQRLTIRVAAARALAKAGGKARPALAELLAASEDPNAEVKEAVQAALKAVGPLGKEDVPLVAAGLKAETSAARCRACRSLGSLGPNAGPAAKDLADALGDKVADVRAEAAAALGKVGAEAKAVSKAIIQTTKDPEAKVRMSAVTALAKIDAGDEGTAALIGAMGDADDLVATVAGKVLRDSGKAGKKHVPALAAVATSKNAESRRFAVSILGPFAAQSPEALTAITGALADETKGVRLAAVGAVGAAGPQGAKAVPALRRMLADDSGEVQKAAIEALGKIGPKAEAATPTLVGLMKDKDVGEEATAALVKIGRGSVDALLAAIEKTKDFKARVALVKLLGAIGPDAVEAAKPLRDMLQENPTPGLRTAIRDALAKIEKKKPG
jgi:HEAT repeat protein